VSNLSRISEIFPEMDYQVSNPHFSANLKAFTEINMQIDFQ